MKELNKKCIGCKYLDLFHDGTLKCKNKESKMYDMIIGFINGCSSWTNNYADKEYRMEDDGK